MLILPVVKHYLPARTLAQSLNEAGDAYFDSDLRTNLTRRLSAAMAKPIAELDSSEIALLLRQNVGGALVLAIGLMLVEEAPMARADHFWGDMLELVMERSWPQWLATEAYGVDPYGLVGSVEGMAESLRGMADRIETHEKRLQEEFYGYLAALKQKQA